MPKLSHLPWMHSMLLHTVHGVLHGFPVQAMSAPPAAVLVVPIDPADEFPLVELVDAPPAPPAPPLPPSGIPSTITFPPHATRTSPVPRSHPQSHDRMSLFYPKIGSKIPLFEQLLDLGGD